MIEKTKKPFDNTCVGDYTSPIGLRQNKSKRSSKTPEGKVKDRVKEILDREPQCWYFMPVQNGAGQSGIPDFIVCWRGKFVGIETKSKKTSRKVTALQAKQIERINTAGGTAVVINEDNIDTLEMMLNGLGH